MLSSVMLCHSGKTASPSPLPSAHLPRPTILVCLISGDVDHKYKASILTSPFKHCLRPHLTIHRLYPFTAPILVYKRAHSYNFTERLNSEEGSQRTTLFLHRMWQFELNFNELCKIYISVKTS